jgi:hypothetical protein
MRRGFAIALSVALVLVYTCVLLALFAQPTKPWSPVDAIKAVLGVTAFFVVVWYLVVYLNIEKPSASSSLTDYDIAMWDSTGMFTDTNYIVKRAFEVKEVEDEGPHFFLELENGSVLLMSGQHLMDIGYGKHEGIQQVRFPSSHMAVRRYSQSNHSDILCTGEPLEYDTLPETYWKSWGDDYPEDERLFTNKSFDELKHMGDGFR